MESDLFTKYQITALPQASQSARWPWVLVRLPEPRFCINMSARMKRPPFLSGSSELFHANRFV